MPTFIWRTNNTDSLISNQQHGVGVIDTLTDFIWLQEVFELHDNLMLLLKLSGRRFLIICTANAIKSRK